MLLLAPPLHATVGGQPVAIRTALAVESAPGLVDVTLTTSATLRCRDARAAVLPTGPGETLVRLSLAQRLTPAGALEWRLISAWYDGTRGRAAQPMPGLAVDAAVGRTFDLPIALQLASGRSPARTVALQGTVVGVRGCGAAAPRGEPIPANPQPATLTIAGAKLPLRGATLRARPNGSLRLTLSTSPLGCRRGQRARANLDLKLAGDPLVATYAYLDGTLFDSFASAGLPDSAIGALQVRRVGDDLRVSGRLRLGGYPITVEGTLRPRRCE